MKFAASYNGFEFPISALGMVQLVAERFGYANLDIDPGPDKTVIKSDKLTVSGKTIEEACESFVQKVLGRKS